MVCFLDVLKGRKSRAGPPPETSGAIFTHDIQDAQRDVIYLDVIPVQNGSAGSITNDVVLVHADGEVRCLAGDLKEERWRASPRTVLATAGDDSLKADIEYADVADVTAGREGLLQGQGDAVAILDSQVNKDPQNSWRIRLLILMSKLSANSGSQSQERTLHVLAICPEIGLAKTKFNRGTIRSLCKLRLPELENTSSKLGKVSVHVSSGTLQFISGGVLFTYDLTGTSPKLLSKFQGTQKDIVSFLRLPSGHALTVTPTSLTIYDLFYESIQATMPITESRPHASSSLKRKYTGTADQQQEYRIDLLTYLPSLGFAIGRINNQLVGYDLSLGDTGQAHAKRIKTGSLIDALGRGIRSERSSTGPASLPMHTSLILGKAMIAPSPKQDARWQARMEQLEQCARSQDVEGFEKAFAIEVDVRRNEVELREWKSRKEAWELAHSRDRSLAQVNGKRLPNGTHNVDLVSSKASSGNDRRDEAFPERKPIPEWYWTETNGETKSQKPIHPEKVILILEKIFSWNAIDGQTPIDGHLTNGKPDGSLSIVFYPPNVVRWLLESGNLTLRNIDLALRDAGAKFNRQSLVTPESLVMALLEFDSEANLLMSFLHAPVFLGAGEVVRAMKPLMYRLSRDASPSVIEEDLSQRTLSLVARGNSINQERHANHATSTRSLEKALWLGLTKLNNFSAPKITKAFRSFLTMDELIFVVHSLRRNLAAQGWTSWHFDAEEADAEPGDNNGGINLIANLLSCTLDSFGAASLIYSPSESSTLADPDELITALKAEISAALEVIEEATYLRGVVGEMLRYGKQGRTATKNNGRPKGPTDIVVVNTSSTSTKLLPLGLKREAEIPREKIKAGGVMEKRSARDIARLESMKVGKYTIERITV